MSIGTMPAFVAAAIPTVEVPQLREHHGPGLGIQVVQLARFAGPVMGFSPAHGEDVP
jgi:hypothetical protein